MTWSGNVHWNLERGMKKMCPECYASNNRITPLLGPLECLENLRNIFAELAGVLSASNMTRREVCKDGISLSSLLSEYKSAKSDTH